MTELQPYFSASCPFEQMFPSIGEATVSVSCRDGDTQEDYGVRQFSKDTLSAKVKCFSHYCSTGFLNIQEIILAMVKQGKTQESGSRGCNGRRGSLKEKRLGDFCDCSFSYSVEIKYKQCSSI